MCGSEESNRRARSMRRTNLGVFLAISALSAAAFSVYAPAQTWHRVRFAGTAMATRLAIVGYANSHVFQPPE